MLLETHTGVPVCGDTDWERGHSESKGRRIEPLEQKQPGLEANGQILGWLAQKVFIVCLQTKEILDE